MVYPKSWWRPEPTYEYCQKCGKKLNKVFTESTYDKINGQKELHWRKICPDFREFLVFNNGHDYWYAGNEHLEGD